jgi:hypothetical protein
MKYMKVSRISYLVAAIIVLIYILALALKAYVFYDNCGFYHNMTGEMDWLDVLRLGSWPLFQLSSAVMLVCFFAILHPFLIISMRNYASAPVASILAFIGMFFSFSVKIYLQTYFLLEMQQEIPTTLALTQGTGIVESALSRFSSFRTLQWVLDFPVTFSLLISSLLLAITFKRQPGINDLLKAAFYMYACYLLAYLGFLFKGTYEVTNYNRPFFPLVEMFVYALILVCLIRVAFPASPVCDATSETH